MSALNAYDNTVKATVENGSGTAATLTVNAAIPSTYDGTIQNGAGGSLALTKAGSSTLYLTGNGTYTGGTKINAGVLNFATGALPLSGIAFGGGTLQWASGNTQDVSAGFSPIAAGQTAFLDLNGNSVGFASTLTGSGGLAMGGTGYLTLLANNTYSGTTTLDSGTLQIGADGNTGTLGNGNVVLGSGAVALVFDRGNSYTVNNNISGPGAIAQIGGGTTTLAGTNNGLGPIVVTGNGALSVAGSTSVAAGTVIVGALTGNSNVLYVQPGSTLNVSGAYPSLIAGANPGASGTISMTGGTLNTASELWLSSATGATGTMNMSGGVANIGSWLAVGRGGDSGMLNVSGGSLTVATNNLTIASFAGNSGTLNVSGGTVDTVNSVYVGESGTGTITQTGGLLIAGGNVIAGVNGSATGTINISGGSMIMGSALEVESGTGSITVSQTGSTPTLVNPNLITLGLNSGALGTLTQNGGKVTMGNNVWNGQAAGSQGLYNLHGGSLTAYEYRTDSGTGMMYQDGGNALFQYVDLGINSGANGSYTLAGGSLTVNAYAAGNAINVGDVGTGTLTVGGSNGGSLFVNAGSIVVANGSGGGVFNLQPGGRLRVPSIAEGAGAATFNFSGGTLQNAIGGNLSVAMPVDLLGPGTVDIDSGQTGAFGALAPISGGGSLYVAGGGTLTLSGTNTYTGGTTVLGNATLIVSSPEALDANDVGTSLSVGSASELALFGGVVPADVSIGGHAASAVPEPSALAILAAATGCLLLRRRGWATHSGRNVHAGRLFR